MKRNHIIILIIIIAVVVVVAFPTPHIRLKQDLVKTLDCSTTLADGQSLGQGWVDMLDKTKIVIDIQSSESVDVTINGGTITLYSQSGKIHAYTNTYSFASYTVSVINPTWFGTGPAAVMTGSIKAYHVYNETVWWPWWMP